MVENVALHQAIAAHREVCPVSGLARGPCLARWHRKLKPPLKAATWDRVLLTRLTIGEWRAVAPTEISVAAPMHFTIWSALLRSFRELDGALL